MARQRIRPDVVKALMVMPVIVYPQGGANSMGDTEDGTPTTLHGYVYENAEKVINMAGEEELSNMQIYLQGDEAKSVALSSLISCLDAIKSRIISREVYYGRQGAAIIGVLYLP